MAINKKVACPSLMGDSRPLSVFSDPGREGRIWLKNATPQQKDVLRRILSEVGSPFGEMYRARIGLDCEPQTATKIGKEHSHSRSWATHKIGHVASCIRAFILIGRIPDQMRD